MHNVNFCFINEMYLKSDLKSFKLSQFEYHSFDYAKFRELHYSITDILVDIALVNDVEMPHPKAHHHFLF